MKQSKDNPVFNNNGVRDFRVISLHHFFRKDNKKFVFSKFQHVVTDKMNILRQLHIILIALLPILYFINQHSFNLTK